jgi:hypothetical protein
MAVRSLRWSLAVISLALASTGCVAQFVHTIGDVVNCVADATVTGATAGMADLERYERCHGRSASKRDKRDQADCGCGARRPESNGRQGRRR